MDRLEVIKAAAGSIEVFGKLFMGKAMYAATPDFHKAIYRDLQNNSIKKLGIIAPRGHAKSSVTSIIFVLWRIIFKPPEEDLLILLISESQSQSINFLTVVKHNLAFNAKILHYFGSFEGDKWTEDEIMTSNGVRILAKGTGQRVRGTVMGREAITRPNLIILDDFESETNSMTPEAIDKNKDWILKAVEPSLSDDGRIVAVGTIINKRAFLEDIRKPGSGYMVHFYQAFKDGAKMTEPLWPERFSKEKLLGIYDSYKVRGRAAAFWQEYMNIAIDMDSQTFKADNFIYYPEEAECQLIDGRQPAIRAKYHPYQKENGWSDDTMIPLYVTVGTDLAISETHTADYTVNFALGTDPLGYKFVLQYDRLKTKDIDVIVDKMIQKCLQYNAAYINIETIQFQQAVANQFRKRCDEMGVYFGVSETKPRTSKDSRIRSLQPLFNGKKVFLKESMTELEDELLNFPSAAHDDLLDGFYLAEQEAMTPDIGPFQGDMLPEHDEEEVLSWVVL